MVPNAPLFFGVRLPVRSKGLPMPGDKSTPELELGSTAVQGGAAESPGGASDDSELRAAATIPALAKPAAVAEVEILRLPAAEPPAVLRHDEREAVTIPSPRDGSERDLADALVTRVLDSRAFAEAVVDRVVERVSGDVAQKVADRLAREVIDVAGAHLVEAVADRMAETRRAISERPTPRRGPAKPRGRDPKG